MLVFDYGGGTLDVSILAVCEYSMEVCATSGDTFLGGRDFDTTVVQLCQAKILSDMGINLENSNSAETKEHLRVACTKAKCALSSADSTIISLMNIDGTGQDWSMELTREQFEESIRKYETRFL